MKLFSKPLINWIEIYHKILLVTLLSVFINFITYRTGGTQFSWTQMNVVVIFLAAYFWQIKGSFVVAFLLGLVVGPFMPLNVFEGIMQTPRNWIFRILIYLFIALISGYIFKKIEESNKQIKEESQISSFTGLYNTNKLFPKLDKMIAKDENFCLIFFKVVNLEGISEYVNYKIVKRIIHKGISSVKNDFENSDLYSVNFNEYILVLKGYDENQIIKNVSNYIENYLDLMTIDNYSFKLVIKSGISFYNGGKSDATEIFNKARIAADQGEINESGVYTYDIDFNKNQELFYEISGSLNNAIINDEFFLVFQPIINLQDNSITDAEVLLRWNRGERQTVGPQFFIPIAEKTGLINEITKWVIQNTLIQIKKWEKNGLKIKTTINMTSREIADKSFRDWAKKTITESGVNGSHIGIEMTERVFYQIETKICEILKELKKQWYKILVDDFGTGYNSLMTISKIPFDIIKKDKYFIDRLNKREIKLLVKHNIELIHEMGGRIVAEGVETKEQFKILKELGCDMIQGYYFSKPILSSEFEEYYKTFDMEKYL